MATYPTGWLRLPTDAKDFKERFAWSHVKAIFYDKAKNILLKDKLDAMDKLISDHADAIANKLMTNDAFNTAIADYVTKSMMSGVQVNDGDHVPTSALAYAMQQAITANANAITKLNSEVSARWNNATPKTLWINVIPSAINTDYKYQHNSLIGANMVSLAFESAVYDILILTGNGRTYGTTVANTFTDDPYWKSTIQASFDSNTGTVTFRILFKGSSQMFNNLALKAVTYLKIG